MTKLSLSVRTKLIQQFLRQISHDIDCLVTALSLHGTICDKQGQKWLLCLIKIFLDILHLVDVLLFGNSNDNATVAI